MHGGGSERDTREIDVVSALFVRLSSTARGGGRSGQWQRIKHGRRAAATARTTRPCEYRRVPGARPSVDAIFASVLSIALYVCSSAPPFSPI